MRKNLTKKQLKHYKEEFLRHLDSCDLNVVRCCKKSGLPRSTYNRLMGQNKAVPPDIAFKAAVENIQHNWKRDLIELGQSELKKAVKKGDYRMIRYLLSTLGKDDGFSIRHELTGKDGSEMPTPRIMLNPDAVKKVEQEKNGATDQDG